MAEQSYYYKCGGVRYALKLSELPGSPEFPAELQGRGCLAGDDCPEGTPGQHVARAVTPAERDALMADDEDDTDD